ncbi:MAG: hypothetical protein KIG72_10470, partial [Bradymonadales bacterium]|nr:hypothetical protein [Bradymonadales bacterium]
IVHAPMHPVANAIPTPIAADRNAVAVNVLNPSLRFEMPQRSMCFIHHCGSKCRGSQIAQ